MSAEHVPSEERLKELLVGQSIVSATTSDVRPSDGWWGGLPPVGELTLSNGTVLKVYGNDGGCGCNAGCYELTELNAIENIITNVETLEMPDDGYKSESYGGGTYKVFVYADNEKVNLATFDGTDGNGYYGTGWWLEVSE